MRGVLNLSSICVSTSVKSPGKSQWRIACCEADRKWRRDHDLCTCPQPQFRRSFRKVLLRHESCSSLEEMHFTASESAVFSYLSSVFPDRLRWTKQVFHSFACAYLLSTYMCQGATYGKQNFIVSHRVFSALRCLIWGLFYRELIARLWTWHIETSNLGCLKLGSFMSLSFMERLLQKGINSQVSPWDSLCLLLCCHCFTNFSLPAQKWKNNQTTQQLICKDSSSWSQAMMEFGSRGKIHRLIQRDSVWSWRGRAVGMWWMLSN